MTDLLERIKLDTDCDNTFCDRTNSGTAYVIIPVDDGELSVEFYFETDSDYNINLLDVGDAYFEDKDEGIQELTTYTLQDEHKADIKWAIEVFVEQETYTPDNDGYDRYRDHGMTNSDFLYGFTA